MKNILFILILIITLPAQGQDSLLCRKKFSFGFNVGNGYPLGNYGSISTSKLPMSLFTKKDTNSMSGYAKPGTHYGGYISYEFTPQIGITFSIEGDQNDFDLNQLNAQYFAYFPPNTASVFTLEEYYLTELFIGPHLNYPLSKYCSVQCRVMADYISVTNPELIYNGKDTVTYEYSQGTCFAYKLGMTLKYEVTPGANIVFGFHIDTYFTGGVIDYPNYSITYSTPFNSYSYNSPKTMTLGIIQVAIGAHLAF